MRELVLERSVLHFSCDCRCEGRQQLRAVCVQKSIKADNMERAYIEF